KWDQPFVSRGRVWDSCGPRTEQAAAATGAKRPYGRYTFVIAVRHLGGGATAGAPGTTTTGQCPPSQQFGWQQHTKRRNWCSKSGSVTLMKMVASTVSTYEGAAPAPSF